MWLEMAALALFSMTNSFCWERRTHHLAAVGVSTILDVGAAFEMDNADFLKKAAIPFWYL